MISRRTIIRLLAFTSVAWPRRRISAVATQEDQIKPSKGYGTGRYGTGAYPGYKLYLPTIKQGE